MNQCEIHFEKDEDKHFEFWKLAQLKRQIICEECWRKIEYYVMLTMRRATESVSSMLYKEREMRDA